MWEFNVWDEYAKYLARYYPSILGFICAAIVFISIQVISRIYLFFSLTSESIYSHENWKKRLRIWLLIALIAILAKLVLDDIMQRILPSVFLGFSIFMAMIEIVWCGGMKKDYYGQSLNLR